MNPDLCWRVEAACLAAFPATQEQTLAGWHLRRSGGSTRRTNSANPGRNAGPAIAVLATARVFYARHDQPVIVRVPDIVPTLDAELDAAGFGPAEAPTATLYAERLDTSPRAASGIVVGSDRPGIAWLTARAALSGASATDEAVFAAMAEALAGPVRFVGIAEGTHLVAIAYGAIRGGLLVIESVATAPSARRRGHGRTLVAALSAWGATMGASGACLQVVRDNAPARALYHDLGFVRMLYGCHYRRPPPSDEPGSPA